MKTLRTIALLLCLAAAARANELGIFEWQSDIGIVAKAGSCAAAAMSNSWIVAGGGANMWSSNDAFHFVSKPVSGDFAFRSAIEWIDAGGNAHRKACLMVRQSLEADSPYVDVAVHGDGLISLQYRETAGGVTREIQARPSAGPAGHAAAPTRATADIIFRCE